MCVTSAAPVLAHGELQSGELPFIVGGEIVGGQTTWGVITAGGDGLRRVCDESFPLVRFVHRRPNGTFLVGADDGLHETTDACSYTKLATAVAERSASAVAVHATGAMLVTTSALDSSNSIYRSEDGGATFVEVLTPRDDLLLFDVSFNAAGDRAIASGTDLDTTTETGVGVPVVLRSDDGGVTFQDVSADLQTFSFVRALGFDVDDQAALLGGVDEIGEGALLRLDAETSTPELLSTFPSEITHAVTFEGSRFVLARGGAAFFKQDAGVGPFVAIGDNFTAPTDCLFAADDGASLIGCGRGGFLSIGLFAQSFDGGLTWETAIDFDVPYRVCPDDSPGFTSCLTFIETRCQDGEDDDFDGMTDCQDPECPPCVDSEDVDGGPLPDARPPAAGPPTTMGCSAGGGSGSGGALSTLCGALMMLSLRSRRPLR